MGTFLDFRVKARPPSIAQKVGWADIMLGVSADTHQLMGKRSTFCAILVRLALTLKSNGPTRC